MTFLKPLSTLLLYFASPISSMYVYLVSSFILTKSANSMISFLVTYGVNSKEQRSIVRTFLRNIYNVNVDQILTAVMNEYTDYRHTGENKMVNRDTLLAIFSDARVAAPVLQSASLHSEAKEPNRAYLYVFKHVTKKGYYPEVSNITIVSISN